MRGKKRHGGGGLGTKEGCQGQVKKVADNYQGVLLMVCFFSGVLLKKRVAVCSSDWGVVVGVQVVEDGGVHWVGVRV